MEKNPLQNNNSTEASVAFMITKDMKQQLADLGYKKEDWDAMTPEEAQRVISSGETKGKVTPTTANPPENKKTEYPVKKEKRIFRAALVETTKLAESQARDIADHRMTESKEDRSANWFKRTMKRIWKHNLAQEYYRQKEIARAKDDIFESSNLYAGVDGVTDSTESQAAMDAVIERFTSEYGDEVLNKGEERAHVQDARINTAAKELIKRYAGDPNMSEAAFRAEKERIMAEIDPTYGTRGRMHADNLLDIAMEVRKAVNEGEKLDELDFDVQIILGKAEESLNTEAQKNSFDRVMEKAQNSPVGKYLMNNGAVATASILWSTGAFLGNKLLRSNAAKVASLGGTAALAGAMSGVKESARLNRERGQHMRERAKGMQFNEEGMKRREQMEENLYEMKGAAGIISQLEADIEKAKAGTLSPDELNAAFANLADIEARIKLGDERKVDLVSYSNFATLEKEKTDLVLGRARLKAALRRGIEDNILKLSSGDTFDAHLASLTQTQMRALAGGEGGLEEKDKVFMKMKRKKVALAVTKGILIGGAAGIAAQEIGALVNPDQSGIFGGTEGGEHHVTALEGLRRWMTGDNPRMPLGNGETLPMGNGYMQVPEGVQIINQPDGTVDIVREGVPIAEHLPLATTPGGDLSDETKALLQEYDIYTTPPQFVAGQAQEHFTGSAKEFLDQYKITHRIHRDMWFDNDTAEFDRNELKTDWGGLSNTGIDQNGNFVFNVHRMTADGSFHEGLGLDAKSTMHGGGLKMLLSLSRGTQHEVLEVPVDANGNVLIEKDSLVAKLMFENQGGHAVFKGQFAEVAVSNGMAEDGGENVRILSTVVGEGRDNVDADLVVPKQMPVIRLDVPADWDWDVPPVIPIFGRRPLERGNFDRKSPVSRKKESGELTPIEPLPYYFTSGYYDVNANLEERSKAMRSETLADPSAQLDQFKEGGLYIEKQNETYKENLRNLAEQMGPMDPSCRVSVCIPVAGHQEEAAIYNSLKNYAAQTAKKGEFELVLFVNRPEKDTKGNPVAPDGTMNEILRFKKDFPDVRVRIAEQVLPLQNANIGYIRKVLNDSVIMRNQARGESAPELFLVSNDADNKGMAPEYIENFITKFDAHPEVDSMLGQLDWDPESYKRNPLIHIGTRLFQYIEIQSRQRGWHIGSSGANFALRASIYAGIGGYAAGIPGGEDTDLGERIKLARQGAPEKIPIAFAGARTSRMYTSSRRAEKSLKEGLSPIEQWDKGFGAFDDEVRKVRWEDVDSGVNFDDPASIERLISGLEMVINRTIARTGSWGGNARDPLLARSLNWLGVKYEVVDDKSIKITDATKLLDGLRAYQTEGIALYEKKKGAKISKGGERGPATSAKNAPVEVKASPGKSRRVTERMKNRNPANRKPASKKKSPSQLLNS